MLGEWGSAARRCRAGMGGLLAAVPPGVGRAPRPTSPPHAWPGLGAVRAAPVRGERSPAGGRRAGGGPGAARERGRHLGSDQVSAGTGRAGAVRGGGGAVGAVPAPVPPAPLPAPCRKGVGALLPERRPPDFAPPPVPGIPGLPRH